MQLAEARELWNYNRWAHERVWQCVLSLDEARFVRDTGYAFSSVRGQVVHVMSVDLRWRARLLRLPVPPGLEADAYQSPAEAYQHWKEIAESFASAIEQTGESGMEATIEYDMPHRGGIKRNTAAEIVRHVVNHGTDHRAQTLSMLHRVGAPTVEQDMMIDLWERG